MSNVVIEMIEWVDSEGTRDPWTPKEDVVSLGMLNCISVGFVIHESDDVVVIAQSISQDEYGHPLGIPKVSIKNRMKLGAAPEGEGNVIGS